MANNILENPDLVDKNSALREGAECLLAYLNQHDENNQAHDVLKFLANETISQLDKNKENWKFTNQNLYKAVVDKNKEVDYSAWFSRIWKKINQYQIENNGVEKFATLNNYRQYAWIARKEGGGAGNQTQYYLEAKRVSEEDQRPFLGLKHDVEYIVITNVSPSWWAKWLFNQNFSANIWKTKIYILYYPIVSLLLSILIIIFFWLLLSSKKQTVSAQDIMNIIFMLGLSIYSYFKFNNLISFLEDRIIMAPQNLLGLKEKMDVCLELVTTEDKNNRFLRLIKYASQCPICQAEILLDKGEPDFPRRIVGRCKESPREHVYSFDRITLTGNRLR